MRKGLSQESHAQEQRSPGRGSPASFPSFATSSSSPEVQLPAQVCSLGTQLPSSLGTPPPAFPKGCFGGRRGERAGQGNYLVQCFVVRNRSVVLKKAWMWQQVSLAKLASCPLLRLAVAVQLPAGMSTHM